MKASLSHFKGADTPIVDLVTAGFKAMRTEYAQISIAGSATSQWDVRPPQLAASSLSSFTFTR
jgi:hypothetical protein